MSNHRTNNAEFTLMLLGVLALVGVWLASKM